MQDARIDGVGLVDETWRVGTCIVIDAIVQIL